MLSAMGIGTFVLFGALAVIVVLSRLYEKKPSNKTNLLAALAAILAVADMFLGSPFKLWVYLLAMAAFVAAILTVALKPDRKTLHKMLHLGLFLAVFDFIFETAGAYLGYWISQGSLFPLPLLNIAGFEGVPLEVFFIAICAGAAYRLLFKPKWDASMAITSSLLIALVGTGIEAILLGQNLLVYMGGWTSFHALVSYFAVFLLIHAANSRLA